MKDNEQVQFKFIHIAILSFSLITIRPYCFDYVGCERNTDHNLNIQLCGMSEHRQLALVS